MNSGSNRRTVLYSIAGVYLVYLAFSLFRELGNIEGTGRIIAVIAMIAFAVIGVGLVGWAFYNGWIKAKELSEAQSEKEIEEGPGEESDSEIISESEEEDAV